MRNKSQNQIFAGNLHNDGDFGMGQLGSALVRYNQLGLICRLRQVQLTIPQRGGVVALRVEGHLSKKIVRIIIVTNNIRLQ